MTDEVGIIDSGLRIPYWGHVQGGPRSELSLTVWTWRRSRRREMHVGGYFEVSQWLRHADTAAAEATTGLRSLPGSIACLG